jgi:hypothetical protein
MKKSVKPPLHNIPWPSMHMYAGVPRSPACQVTNCYHAGKCELIRLHSLTLHLWTTYLSFSDNFLTNCSVITTQPCKVLSEIICLFCIIQHNFLQNFYRTFEISIFMCLPDFSFFWNTRNMFFYKEHGCSCAKCTFGRFLLKFVSLIHCIQVPACHVAASTRSEEQSAWWFAVPLRDWIMATCASRTS